MNLQRLGRVPKGYHYVTGRHIDFYGLIETPCLIIKQYGVRPMHKPIKKTLIQTADNFLQKVISNDQINTGIGFGFSVLSSSVVPEFAAHFNVCLWDKEHPTYLVNHPFIVERDGKRYSIKDGSHIRSYPIWTLCIVNHEGKAWNRYLESRVIEEESGEMILATQRSEEAKRAYLGDRCWQI